MSLKFQEEIDKLELNNCPTNVAELLKAIVVFRFSYTPIEHEHNFLPNVIIDKIKNAPVTYELLSSNEKCLRCGTSFYLGADFALKKWKRLPIQFKENYGYTHLASGTLEKGDGLMSESKNNHFTFYQNENVQLENKFENIIEL